MAIEYVQTTNWLSDAIESYTNTLTTTSFPASPPSVSLPAGYSTEMNKSTIIPYHLVHFNFNDGSLFYTDAHTDISYGGNTWVSNGLLLQLPSFTEDAGFTNRTVSITLNSVDQAITAIALNDFDINQKVYIYRGFFQEDSETMDMIDPVLLYVGYLDSFQLDEGNTSKLTWTLVSVFSDYERSSGRTANQEDLEARLGEGVDYGFEHVTDVLANLSWGKV